MSQPTAPSGPTIFSVFRNRSFALMWSGQLVSTIGNALTSLAAGILVFRITGSALSVGLMLMATAIPTLFLGLVAGVFVDRYDRKRIMVWSNLIQAALVFAIPFLASISIVWLYVIVMLVSGVSQFFDPAHESVLPEIASDEELAAANSFMAISSFGSTAVGFAAAGLLASQFSIEWAFWIDGATFLLSAIFLMGVRVEKLGNDEKTSVGMVLRNMRTGAHHLFSSDILRSLLLIGLGVSVAIGLWNVLLLPFAERALGASEFVYGLQEGLTSVGFVLGSFLMAAVATRLREGQWIVISLVASGALGIVYAFVTDIPLAILLIAISGFFNAPLGVANRLLVQRNTTRENRGRVNSVFYVARDVFFLIGMGLAGLADIIDVRIMFAAASALSLVLGFVAAVMPGIGLPAAEWRRAVSLLRGASAAPGLGPARAASVADYDMLAGHVPAVATLSVAERRELAARTLIADAPAGTTIVRRGDASDAGYFVIEGRVVAGWDEEGGYRPLETLNAGDFFGEIAALTGATRTANVVAEEDTVLLQVPSASLREMSTNEALNRLFLSKLTERMVRMNMVDLPRFSGIDQASLKELRSADPAQAGTD
jgi:MFS family permease